MKLNTAIAVSAASALSLSACADMGGRHDHYVQAEYADGYYDDFYGPIDAGYWGDDGVFRYRGSDHQFHRDDGGHFRKDAAQGFHTVHAPAIRPEGGGRPDHG